jgi:hypothetical protein
MSGQTFFDPFLPCNSHHIRGSRRRGQGVEQAETESERSSGVSSGSQTSSPSSSNGGGNGNSGGSGSASQGTQAPMPPNSASAASDSRPHNPDSILNLLSNLLGGAPGTLIFLLSHILNKMDFGDGTRWNIFKIKCKKGRFTR